MSAIPIPPILSLIITWNKPARLDVRFLVLNFNSPIFAYSAHSIPEKLELEKYH